MNISISPTAMCLRWTINWAKEKSFESLWFESDVESVVKCVSGQVEDTSISPVILECEHVLSLMHSTRVSFASRTCSLAAHNLVRMASLLGPLFWQGMSLNLVYL